MRVLNVAEFDAVDNVTVDTFLPETDAALVTNLNSTSESLILIDALAEL